LPVSTGRCQPSFHRAFYRERSTAHSCRRLHGLQSNRIGAPIHSALIASPGPLRLAAERRAAGLGGSGTARAACPSRSARHPRPTAKAHTHWAQDFAACGVKQFIASAGIDLWRTGPNKNAVWHCACVVAWQFWNAPSSETRLLRRLQSRRCTLSGGRLWRNAEVDHRVPLFRVWSEHRDTPWPGLLDFWGLPNLQLINRDVHAAKCVIEARARRAALSPASETIG
jgi:hypothetical protein